ncbi:hypothetical protein PW52_10755 [Tamlana sedimentorum]|uniref:Uncharacterized protein n=1 Tax=Neotamlana sedimentorum TaxID=1435349 RepID=A0A0D7W7R1_9FLAO|nr:hypothetical protein [Tamlana sedimentorum]KJD35156.1 hypothetical protein PW52_10755 [Tamlana sedimentorum]
MNSVLVFKTSITSQGEIKQLKPVLNTLIAKNDYWNFDLEDCDNIFRVETKTIEPRTILQVFKGFGFYCEELV